MILVDTSVWVDHLRSADTRLAAALDRQDVRTHPFVIGELACGTLRNRAEILRLIGDLPGAPVASHLEVMGFIENRRLMGRGLGYVDVHLLGSVVLSPGTTLWTRDLRVLAAARDLGVAFEE